jgi:testicular acid phosphatase
LYFKLFRHGIRSVLLTYPNDTKGQWWPRYGGLGQLTPAGMRQMSLFGQFFRNKYQTFLNPTYDRSRVFIRSTDYDRTLQSAYSFLSGVYKPNDDQKWNNFSGLFDYLPIPVHTTNLSTDIVR